MAQTPAQIAQKWNRNLSASGPTIEAGVRAVTESPTARAARAQDRYLLGVQNAVSSGRYQQGLQRVSLADWQNAFLSKGLSRIASGASAAVGRVEQFLQQFLPYVEQGVRALPPRGDLNQNMQRAIAMIEHNARFRRQNG